MNKDSPTTAGHDVIGYYCADAVSDAALQ